MCQNVSAIAKCYVQYKFVLSTFVNRSFLFHLFCVPTTCMAWCVSMHSLTFCPCRLNPQHLILVKPDLAAPWSPLGPGSTICSYIGSRSCASYAGFVTKSSYKTFKVFKNEGLLAFLIFLICITLFTSSWPKSLSVRRQQPSLFLLIAE